MRNVVIAVVVGVAVACGAYFLWGTQNAALKEQVNRLEQAAQTAQKAVAPSVSVAAVPHRHATTITLTRATDGTTNCVATIEDPKFYGKAGHKVAWMIEDADEDGCLPTGNWRLELRFGKGGQPDFPFPNRIVNIGRHVEAHKIKKTAKPGDDFKYEIWMVGQKDKAEYMLLDPDLEVEPPSTDAVPPPPPPPPPPPTRPPG